MGSPDLSNIAARSHDEIYMPIHNEGRTNVWTAVVLAMLIFYYDTAITSSLIYRPIYIHISSQWIGRSEIVTKDLWKSSEMIWWLWYLSQTPQSPNHLILFAKTSALSKRANFLSNRLLTACISRVLIWVQKLVVLFTTLDTKFYFIKMNVAASHHVIFLPLAQTMTYSDLSFSGSLRK